MAASMKALGIDRLNSADRIALALEIWASLGDDRPSPALTPEQRAELHRRDAELDADPSRALTGEQVGVFRHGNWE